MTSEPNIPLFFSVDFGIAALGVVCRCVALRHTLPGTPTWECITRFPNMEHYDEKGQQLLIWSRWLCSHRRRDGGHLGHSRGPVKNPPVGRHR
jgi:hypothetical protein